MHGMQVAQKSYRSLISKIRELSRLAVRKNPNLWRGLSSGTQESETLTQMERGLSEVEGGPAGQ
jgi:hypothetical protein